MAGRRKGATPDDPTVEEEALEEQFDGSTTDAIDENERVQSTAKNPAGRVATSESGKQVWEWKTQTESGSQGDDTFDFLEALDSDSLDARETRPSSKTTGYDPYDSGSSEED